MSSRPPPPTGRPPVYAVASRMFGRTNLRPLVMGFTFVGALWSLVWGIGAFKDISSDKAEGGNKLVIFDIIIGALYTGVAAIEGIGFYAALSRRLAFAKVFVGLSAAVILMVAGAELLRTIVHFAFKSTLINECVSVATGKTHAPGFSIWGSFRVTSQNAPQFCDDLFNHDSFVVIVWFILATLVALFLASLAYSHYRQLLDPSSSRAQIRSDQVRLDNLGYEGHYGDQEAYNNPSRGYGGGQIPYPTFAPPPGPPPGFGGDSGSGNVPAYEGSKLPQYGYDSKDDLGDFKEKPKVHDPFADDEN